MRTVSGMIENIFILFWEERDWVTPGDAQDLLLALNTRITYIVGSGDHMGSQGLNPEDACKSILLASAPREYFSLRLKLKLISKFVLFSDLYKSQRVDWSTCLHAAGLNLNSWYSVVPGHFCLGATL